MPAVLGSQLLSTQALHHAIDDHAVGPANFRAISSEHCAHAGVHDLAASLLRLSQQAERIPGVPWLLFAQAAKRVLLALRSTSIATV